jgi:epoxyqueuosine reductase
MACGLGGGSNQNTRRWHVKARLLQQLEKRGYRGRVAMIQRLRGLRRAIDLLYRSRLLDEALYQERLAGFDREPPHDLPDTRSLIVVASPQQRSLLTFTWSGKRTVAIVPPTYRQRRQRDQQVQDVLTELLQPEGYRVAAATVPKKLLAVCSGLAAYGKNNISYMSGLGSFYRLTAFYSDLPCEQNQWQEPRMMERCERCLACLRACPTGAITAERFLLRGERCITFHNYRPGHVPFPAWLDPSWHHCLVGCLRCQGVCPENKESLARIEQGPEFTSKETALLLEGVPFDQLPAPTAEKLEEWWTVDRMDILPRNLKVLLERVRK